MVSLVNGDMFCSKLQTLTIPVNTVGVMGKGIALRVKCQYPDVYVKYRDLCNNNVLKMGQPYLYKGSYSFWFLLFPTKTDWRYDSDLSGIKQGLQWLVDNYKTEGITSLAVPALGCGLGRLDWDVVGPIISGYLDNLDIPVNLYPPKRFFNKVNWPT